MESNQSSPEQNQRDTSRVTPSQEDAAKTQPSKTDAEIEETRKEKEKDKHHKTSAAAIDSIIGSPTQNVKSHHPDSSGLANTGTNVSYEGPTSTAAGGTGYNSGQAATGETISSNSEFDAGGTGRSTEDEEREDEE